MSRAKRDILDTERMLERLRETLYNFRGADHTREQMVADAEALRRISMTLHTWHELECGNGHGHIERDEKTNVPRYYNDNARYLGANDVRRGSVIADREAGALKRLKAIMARYPALSYYVQGDPRGCALYILRPGDIPDGGRAESHYSRGLAVFK